MGEAASETAGTRVLIVEPREVLCVGLATMVASYPEVQRYRCVASFDEVVDQVDQVLDQVVDGADGAERADADYDVVVASVEVHGRSSARCARRTIALIESTDVPDLEAAAQVQADGYVLLDETTVDSLRAAVRDVMDGRMALPQVLSAHLLQRARDPDPMVTSRSVRLSPREEDVLELLVAGLSNKQIARQLAISIHGAKRHVSSVLNKFNAPSRSYLISQSLRLGLARPPKSLLPTTE